MRKLLLLLVILKKNGYLIISVPAYQAFYSELHTFCSSDLSAFYFDIRKDALYCDHISSNVRISCIFTLEMIFERLVKWFAPILPFTMEEVWSSRYSEKVESIHLEDFSKAPEASGSNLETEKWERIKDVRKVVTGAIELERKAKKIGSSLEVSPIVT